MSDLIYIHGIEEEAFIGYNPDELIHKQTVIVDLEFPIDLKLLGRTDNPKKVIDVSEIAKTVKDEITRKQRNLIETLAEDIAFRILEEFPIKQILLKVEKPKRKHAKTVGIQISRSKK